MMHCLLILKLSQPAASEHLTAPGTGGAGSTRCTPGRYCKVKGMEAATWRGERGDRVNMRMKKEA